MTTRIILVRHGQTESNATGYYMGWSNEDLNSTGTSQVQKLSGRIVGLTIASVYTSPLQRAYTSALLLAQPHGLEPKVSDDLIEIKLGDWQGLHMDEIRQRWTELWREWRTDPSQTTLPNGESFKQVVERALRAFHKIIADERDHQVLIVTHEIIVKIIVAHVLGDVFSIYRKFEVSNASLSIIRIADGRMRLVTLNDTSHLTV